ncbi:MAG: prepilin-type N-terminal cleavage/methylation domain-containing protein [Deltaproteobacteria bacterium]|nr:prepilin-type N-terminal cleavage/methylation domain-containing protein [Deltaproteobacteria bacterium]
MVTATGRGFSVIELLAALSILGILTAIALPAWNKLLPAFDLSSSARLVHSELQAIRIRSAVENTSLRIAYAAGGTNIGVQRDSSTLVFKPLPGGVSIATAGSISFSPRGTASGNRVRLVGRHGACQQVVVSATGRVRTCKAVCGSDC